MDPKGYAFGGVEGRSLRLASFTRLPCGQSRPEFSHDARPRFTVRKTIDVLIGTFCIEGGHQLLHDDRDFDPMEALLGLVVLR